MTFDEYALRNIKEMKSKEPNAQNMRDVALLELWLVSKESEGNLSPTIKSSHIAKETRDILPAYFDYVEAKRKYQLKEATKEKVIDSLKTLSEELKDLIRVIYRNTDTPEERNLLSQALQQININNA